MHTSRKDIRICKWDHKVKFKIDDVDEGNNLFKNESLERVIDRQNGMKMIDRDSDEDIKERYVFNEGLEHDG